MEIKVPKRKLFYLISVKQSNSKNCTCRGGLDDPEDEQEKQAVSETGENKQNDFLDVEASDPKFSATDDLLRDTLAR